MKNVQIEALFELGTADLFHERFEQFFDMDQNARAVFSNNKFLWKIRTAYLYEYYASYATSLSDKVGFLLAGINMLMRKTTIADASNAITSLYRCHYLAKFNYELGRTWSEAHHKLHHHSTLGAFLEPIAHWASKKHLSLELGQLLSSNKSFLTLAVDAYQKGLSSYDAFKWCHGVHSMEDFCDLAYLLCPDFSMLDCYSPCVRLISINYNLHECSKKSACKTVDHASLSTITQLIQIHKNQVKSLTSLDVMRADIDAVNEVEHQLQAMWNPKPSSVLPSKKRSGALEAIDESELEVISGDAPCADALNGSSSSASEPLTKKIKKMTPPTYSLFESATTPWALEVRDRATFSQSLTSSWIAPGFLKERQQADFRAIYTALQHYEKPLIITKPTGTGKTALFSAIVNQAWQNKQATIIVVPTSTLVEQTRDKLIEYHDQEGMEYSLDHIGIYCPSIGLRSLKPITIITQLSYVRHVANAQKTFPTRASLLNYLEQNPHALFESDVLFHPHFFTLLIVDEGHHAMGERLYGILNHSEFINPALLFSASTLPGEYEELDTLGEHVVTQTLQEAIHSGELSALQVLTVDFSMYKEAKNLTRILRKKLRGKETLDKESKELVMNLLCQQTGFSLTALSLLLQVLAKVPYTRKAMVFTDSIQHANLLSLLLTHLTKKTVHPFHSEMPDRKAVLDGFKQDPHGIIVAVGALDEGFDDPNVNVILDFSIYIHRIRRIIQRLGRALRTREDGSCAILLSIKLLAQDLQLLPRDAVLHDHENGYIGVAEPDILNNQIIHLTLPESLPLTLDNDSNIPSVIHPQSAKVMFPKGRKLFKLGNPPEDCGAMLSDFSILANSEYRAEVSISGASSSSTAIPHDTSNEAYDRDCIDNFLMNADYLFQTF